VLACTPPTVHTTGPPGTGGKTGSAGAGGGAGGGAIPTDPSLRVPDAGADGPTAAPAAEQKCAEDVHQAERVPLDLLLLVDTSGSMDRKIGMTTKWALVHDALVGFIKDPKSAGLGVGLQFFPVDPKADCTTDADCGGPSPFGGSSCAPRRVCVGGTIPAGATPMACSIFPGLIPERCPTGARCVDVGRCSASGKDCFAVGQACPGGMAGDACQPTPKRCVGIAGLPSCAPADYQRLAVPITALPAAEMSIVQTLDATMPAGGTPTGPAVVGALAQARMHQAANSGHRVALVLATDGLPEDCPPLDGASISGPIARELAAGPSISTYVIGVFDPTEAARARPLLEGLATAGGSGTPFVLDVTADLGQRFQEALDKIRGAALSCEFTIPTGSGAIDFGKVNVRWKSAAGQEEVPYVASADRCDPTRGGWYYDVPPAMGTPARVLVCPATCTRFKTDPSANVSLVFGCKTKVIE
jgi:Mg-chelatase subunit ChlD